MGLPRTGMDMTGMTARSTSRIELQINPNLAKLTSCPPLPDFPQIRRPTRGSHKYSLAAF